MRALMLSTDSSIADPQSRAHARAIVYAHELGTIDVIILSSNRTLMSKTYGPLSIHPTGSWSRLFSGFDALMLARRLPKPDVITAQDPFETGLIGVILSRLLRAPLHIQVHTDFLSPEFRTHSWKNRVRVLFAGCVLTYAVRIRVVSERIKQRIENEYRLMIPMSVLPIFVDLKRYRSLSHTQHERRAVSLLFVGRLEPEKRADRAIYALARARSLGIDVELTIVGDGSQREALQSLAQELGVTQWIVFVGQKDPLEYYARADMLLVPSEYEGYGMVIIEALAAGIPVLSTDVGVTREAGAHIAPHDTDGFAGELCSLLVHTTLPRVELVNYPYESEVEYVRMWADDVRLAAQSH